MDAVIQQHRDTMAQIHTELTSLQRKVEELEDQNERLEEELETVKEQAEDSFQAIAEALCGRGNEADSIAGWGWGEDHKIVKRIKDLKEENKELKEKLDGVKDILQTETLASGIQNRFYEILNDDEESDDEE